MEYIECEYEVGACCTHHKLGGVRSRQASKVRKLWWMVLGEKTLGRAYLFISGHL